MKQPAGLADRAGARVRVAAVVVILAAVWAAAASTGMAAEGSITFSVREARAYGHRISLSKEVIEANARARSCDPKTSQYECDANRYNQEPNCPPNVALGRDEPGISPRPPAGASPSSGGSGDGSGSPEHAQSTPVRLNELLTIGRLGNLGPVLEAGGLASDAYVDLGGRQNPEAHAESDAFNENRSDYEERCDPEAKVPDSYGHYLSRSFRRPATYNLAECFRDHCTFGPMATGAGAGEGRTIVRLAQKGGRVTGELSAVLEDLSLAGGAFTVESLETYVAFSSDGTAAGLEWSVATTASGAKLAGLPVALPPGTPLRGPGFEVGVAAPRVEAPADGSALEIVAPGLYFTSEQQTAYFAGAEVDATMGSATILAAGDPERPEDREEAVGGPTRRRAEDPGTPPQPAPRRAGRSEPPTMAPEHAPPPAATVVASPVVIIRSSGTWVPPAMVTMGLAWLLLVVLRWLKRYTWARRLVRIQPLRAVDLAYRAFIKV